MTEALRVGIIGAGAIARDVHIPNYLKQKPHVEIVAVSDVIRENAERLASDFAIEQVFTDYNAMLRDVDLDAVSVCTPNKFHAAATRAALRAGAHVFCEKPPAMNVEEAEAMAEEAEKAGKILMYGFCFRFAPEVKALKRFIDAGELGDVYAARVRAIRRRGIPGWGNFTNKELQGGGPLIDIGVHMLDTALYLMDYPEPDTILGSTYQRLGTQNGVGLFGEWDWQHFSVEDMARGMITFQNGASIMLETAFAANIKQHEDMNVALMGDAGGADVFPLEIYQEKHETLVDITPSHLTDDSMFAGEIARFMNGCLAGDRSIGMGAHGLKIQKIINGLYTSADKGKAVNL